MCIRDRATVEELDVACVTEEAVVCLVVVDPVADSADKDASVVVFSSVCWDTVVTHVMFC